MTCAGGSCQSPDPQASSRGLCEVQASRTRGPPWPWLQQREGSGGQPCHLSLLLHHSPPPISPRLGCWTPNRPEIAHHPLFGATWSRAHCPLAGQGPSPRRCGLPRALSTKESANASVGPKATASLPQLTAAPTSSCISPTWKGSTSRWKATRSPIRCAPSRPRTRSCRLWRWSSPTWRRAPSTRPGPATSSAPRRGQKHPFSLGWGRLWGRGRQDQTGEDILPLEMGLQGGSVVPFKYLLEEGVWGAGVGCSWPPALPLTIATNISPSEKH